MLAEHNGTTGAVIADYVYVGNVLITRERGGTGYFLSDRLSLRVMLDGNGNVAGMQNHLPFGEDFAESGIQQKNHFTTYQRDSETGQDYAVNRSYSPSTGRFGAVDPYSGDPSQPQSWNRYAYVNGDSVNLSDPTGLFCACTPPAVAVVVDGECKCVRPDPPPPPTVIVVIVDPFIPELIQPPDPPPTIEDPDPVLQPLQCNAAVQDAMKKAWMSSTNGTQPFEWGFAVGYNPDGSLFVTKPQSTHVPNQDSVDAPPGSIAVFHTHPTSQAPEPSEGDQQQAQAHHVNIYTITSSGLYIYDWQTKKTTKLAENLDWLKPCT